MYLWWYASFRIRFWWNFYMVPDLMIRTHIVFGRGVCLFVCLSALQTSISFYLQQIQLCKCIDPTPTPFIAMIFSSGYASSGEALEARFLLAARTVLTKNIQSSILCSIFYVRVFNQQIQWAHPFYPQMPGSWCNRYIDIDIVVRHTLIRHRNSVPLRCRAMEVDPTPRLSYLRN